MGSSFHDLIHAVQRRPDVAFYFRYPLHENEFHELKPAARLLGRFAAKPLYGRLTPKGRVDRSAGFNGRIAILFIPACARSPLAARLFFTRLPRACVAGSDGRRNWPAIHEAARRSLIRKIGRMEEWEGGQSQPSDLPALHPPDIDGDR